jgi:hypothetical protein
MKQFFRIVFVILVIGILYYFFDFGFLNGEITEYSLSCDKDKYVNYQCTEKWLTRASTTYKPDKKNQRVFYWVGTFPEIKTLTKCSVVDRENWTCKFNDESAEFGFKDGDYWEIVSISDIDRVIPDIFAFKHVSKWQYRLYEMKWW